MAKIKMLEIYSVTVQAETSHADVQIEPRGVDFNSWREASVAIKRALDLFPPTTSVTVIVSKELVTPDEWAEGDDPGLTTWPSKEHVTA